MNFNKKVAFYTLGCKVNQYETESIKNQLMKLGYEDTNFEEYADIYVINSCTVTSIADKKTRNMMRRAKKTNPNCLVILTGCYAQTNSKELMEIEEIDYVVGNKDKQGIVKLIKELENKKQDKLLNSNIFQEVEYQEYEFATLREMTRAYVKIQDGCNVFCSYCKIPFARGRSRSRKIESIVQEVTRLTEEGFKEIILIGINIGAYGEDFNSPKTFEDLVNTLVNINLVERIRFGSIYPDKMSDEFINLFKNPKVMPHIHVSLQSGDDTVLNMMRRKYGATLIKERMEKIKKEIPKMEFSADVIVGFPGETEDMHKNTYNLIESIGFQDLHVFQYSDRENTLAEKMPNKVDGKLKKQRAEELDKLKEKMGREIRESYLEKELSILVEEIKEGKAVGYSENYLRMAVEDEKLVVGEIYKTSIKELQKGMLRGEEIK